LLLLLLLFLLVIIDQFGQETKTVWLWYTASWASP